MNYNKLPQSELRVSEICFGTWPISGHGMGQADEGESMRTLETALDHGITFFDTADMYGFGYAESLLGKTIKKRKEEAVIATKVGMQWDQHGQLRRNLQKDYVIKACEDSLKRLNIDTIDLYQLHWPDPETPMENTMEALVKLVEQGKVRYIGVSNFSVEEVKQASRYLPIISNQVEYSLLNRSAEEQVIPFAEHTNSSVLPYKVLGRGILTGAFKGTSHFDEGDWRRKESYFQPEALQKSLNAVEKLRSLAEHYGCSVSQLVMAWTLRLEVVPSVIIGTKKSDQIADICSVTGVNLLLEDIEEINKLFPREEERRKTISSVR